MVDLEDVVDAQEEEQVDEEEAAAEAEAENDEAETGDVAQSEINRNWIKSLGQNYPLSAYYKNLKRSLLVILGSTRIQSRLYPNWSYDLFDTYGQLIQASLAIQFSYQNLGLDQTNIVESATALQQGLTQAQKYILARYIAQYLIIV